jgi:hypothetical protein
MERERNRKGRSCSYGLLMGSLGEYPDKRAVKAERSAIEAMNYILYMHLSDPEILGHEDKNNLMIVSCGETTGSQTRGRGVTITLGQ